MLPRCVNRRAKKSLRHRFADDGDQRCIRAVTLSKSTASNHGDPHRLEVAGRNVAITDLGFLTGGGRWLPLDGHACCLVATSEWKIGGSTGSGYARQRLYPRNNA